MQSEKLNITVFIGITTLLILMLGVILVLVIYLYQQKRLIHIQSIKELELNHDKSLINTQLEVQENMFRHISQEIHDNIGLTLSLIKLQLNTLNYKDTSIIEQQVGSSIQLLTISIDQLKDISRSLNADVINSYGLIQAIETEIQRIEEMSGIKIDLTVTGDPIYMDSQKELIIFRIIQESFNNIIKHSQANLASLSLDYGKHFLGVTVIDNGKGFPISEVKNNIRKGSAGIRNMEVRSKMIRGTMEISSLLNSGTTLKFTIPL